MKAIAICGLLLSLSSAAVADCVTLDDAQSTGVIFDLGDGLREHILPPDNPVDLTQISVATVEGEETARSLLAKGIYFVSEIAPGESVIYSVRPVGGYAALPDPEPGLEVTVDVLAGMTGGMFFVEYDIAMSKESVTQVAGCDYRTILIEVRELSDGDLVGTERMLYFVELEVAPFLSFVDPGQEPEVVTFVGITPGG